MRPTRISSILLLAFAASTTLLAQTSPLTPESRGDIYMARKMYREAVDTYKQADPKSPVVANKIGIAFHQMMDLPNARRNYERAAKLNRDYAEAYNNLGTVFYTAKNYRKAIRLYRQALKITPNSASIHSNLGTAYFARKDYKRAFEEYETAIRIDPEVFERRSGHGVLLQERTVTDRARFNYEMARVYARKASEEAVAEARAQACERAVLYLRKALEEGFSEVAKVSREPEFAILKDNVEFQELLARQPKAL